MRKNHIKENMNELEKVLNNTDNEELDWYLDSVPTNQVRADIEEIRRKASNEYEMTQKIEAIRKILIK